MRFLALLKMTRGSEFLRARVIRVSERTRRGEGGEGIEGISWIESTRVTTFDV